jgi:dethiobiotin synthetase
MQKTFFITGTDTNVGKTYVTVTLLRLFNQLGYSTLGIKPIASGGCSLINSQLVNEDAKALRDASSIKLDYHVINPIRFDQAIAPSIAAIYSNEELSLNRLTAKIKPILSYPVNVKLIEGAGGWYVPLNHNELYAGFVKQEKLPVILVVGMRLGCINHAILTCRALQQDKVIIAGWIANFPDAQTMAESLEVLETLKAFIEAPFIGCTPHNLAPQLAMERLI